MLIKMVDIVNKSTINWNFKEDDWLVELVFTNPKLRQKIFTMKNYSASRINEIIYEIYNLVKDYRRNLEIESESFLKKKQYLTLIEDTDDSDKIQITLEDEYVLKDLVEKYKIYELIGWIHLGKNSKIFKICALKKQEILEKIYPIVDLSIRKVIGAKVINPKSTEFEEAVNNAWMAIIKYLPKIDTSKVMFSIFVGIAHRSAIYFNILNLREKYSVVRINDISVVGDDDECVGEDLFISTVANNNLRDNYKTKDVEDSVLNKMDIEEKFYLETDHSTDDIERIIESIEEDNNINYLQENILAYSFNILSGKMKKLCFEKIFAEFFNDLINSNIPEKVINKHTPTLVEVMNLVTLDPSLVDNMEYNNKVYKLFKDWLKEKIRAKLYKYNIKITNDMDEFKREQVLELVKRENRMLKYIKENKSSFMKKLLEFRNNCINFRI